MHTGGYSWSFTFSFYYVNDMSININSDCKLLLYADDSTIMLTHENPEFISRKLGEELEPSSEWLINDKLCLQLGKG